ncbi:hypothetical protein OSCI_10060 [Kamptonema sp. PCC 6506]|nr:hypothetical protein OSCI_10060 [Kamptonema sp. PCC 6506]
MVQKSVLSILQNFVFLITKQNYEIQAQLPRKIIEYFHGRCFLLIFIFGNNTFFIFYNV